MIKVSICKSIVIVKPLFADTLGATYQSILSSLFLLFRVSRLYKQGWPGHAHNNIGNTNTQSRHILSFETVIINFNNLACILLYHYPYLHLHYQEVIFILVKMVLCTYSQLGQCSVLSVTLKCLETAAYLHFRGARCSTVLCKLTKMGLQQHQFFEC